MGRQHPHSPLSILATHRRSAIAFLLIIASVGILHAVTYEPSEPFYNGDEARHVMTGVFFRDFYCEMPLSHPREYAIRYYIQYPALYLIVYPPLFYAVQGLVMLCFGTSMIVAKLTIGLFAILACLFFYLLVLRQYDLFTAITSGLIFVCCPLVFTLSRYVMLEVPTVAMGTASIYFFICYLDTQTRLNVFLASLAASAAALTRFDAVYLLPLFVMLLLARKQLRLLLRRELLLAIALGILLVAPWYILMKIEIGDALQAVLTRDSAVRFRSQFLFSQAAQLPRQYGWFALAAMVLGLSCDMRRERLRAFPFLALILAVVVMQIPLPGAAWRRGIYAAPAFALFAARGAVAVSDWLGRPRWRVAIASTIVLATCFTCLGRQQGYVRGYGAAAEYVLEHSSESPFCLIDLSQEGAFIYEMRHLDPDSKLHTLRAERLCQVPRAPMEFGLYREEDILSVIDEQDPEYIIVEDTSVSDALQSRIDVLRSAMQKDPERFHLKKTIPIDSNRWRYRKSSIQIFRNQIRNPDRNDEVSIKSTWIDEVFQADVSD